MTVFEDQARDFVGFGEIFQHILRGGNGLVFSAGSGGGKFEVCEEDFAKLFWRVDVEAATGKLEDVFADAVEFDGETLGEAV